MLPLARAQLRECRDVTRSIMPGFLVEIAKTPTRLLILLLRFALFRMRAVKVSPLLSLRFACLSSSTGMTALYSQRPSIPRRRRHHVHFPRVYIP
jgi:hypothetical protein